jgi:hypothetical protein
MKFVLKSNVITVIIKNIYYNNSVIFVVEKICYSLIKYPD